jgi:NAD(P)H dehydrogenase (quinone)
MDYGRVPANPLPRMRMLDGFNEGWIEFKNGGRQAIKGRTSALEVITALVDRAEEVAP